MRRARVLGWALALGVGAIASAPSPATACGGTFCDSGPTAMPVDQTGENILFVLDGQSVEAHVQIQYQGTAERFAWVVPMPAIPTVEVGSQPLFSALLQGSVPQYGFTTQFDSCGGADAGLGAGGGFGTGGSGGASGAAGGSGGGPNVVYKKTVGAFEVTVLQGGTAEEVSQWLSSNGYQQIDTAPSILEDYVAQNYVFVAVKLVGGAGVDEIHPLVFRYGGTEPCVPLKLTAVAAVEDMGVRAFFLGDDRVYPAPGYMHVELNPVRLDWLNRASNYTQVVSRAVDSAVANGRAFITEYAGGHANITTQGIWSASWNEAPFVTAAPEMVVTLLEQQALLFCDLDVCQYNHPLVQPLLQQYLPAPSSVEESTFYSDLPLHRSLIDLTKWNGAQFAADMKARIIDPGRHARDLLLRWPYLTRLFTTISPAEMTLDPMFLARPDLSEPVGGITQFATQRVTCDGERGMLLPDTRQVALEAGWPVFSSLMPWAERIQEVPASGPPITLVDNTDVIDEQLALWNAARGWPPSGTGGSGASGSAGTGAGGSGGASAAGGTTSNAGDPGGVSAGGGCGCSVPGGSHGHGALIAALAAFGAAASRRRRRDQQAGPAR